MAGPALGEGLEGRTVIVTGAAGGIGGACARAAAEAGARIAAVDLPGERLDAAVAALGGRGDHLAVGLDLASPAAIEAAVAEVAGRAAPLWGVIHAAAFLLREPIDDVTEESWNAQHDVNLKGTFFLDRAVGRALVEGGIGGRIVNFSSIAWHTGPYVDSDAYAASKGGVVSLTRGFARRYGPHGITVNVIAPGQVDTAMQAKGNTVEAMSTIAADCPLGRMGTPEELAAVALFLVSTHASFVSGATLNVSGGLLMY